MKFSFSPNLWVGSLGIVLILTMLGFIWYMLHNYDSIRQQQIDIVRDYMNSKSKTTISSQKG